MRFKKYELPSMSFPYKITRRLNLMSFPRKYFVDKGEGMPAFSVTGVRKSALTGHASDRVNEASYPYIRRMIILKKQYGHTFSEKRKQRLDRLIEACNTNMYAKLANCQVKLKTAQDSYGKDTKKKKAWNESEWKKHTDYVLSIAKPKKLFLPEPIQRGPHKSLEELLPRIQMLSLMPETKIYKRLSQEQWYKDPKKVSPLALKYNISDRVRKLAEPRVIPTA